MIELRSKNIISEKMSGMSEEERLKEKIVMINSRITEEEDNSDHGRKIDKHQRSQKRRPKDSASWI